MAQLQKKDQEARLQTRKHTGDPLRRRHILIVDDEQHFRFATSIALRRAGYVITEAADGEEALRLLTASPATFFDLMLVDVQMPGMSGVELIEEIRKRGMVIPIFVISGFVDKGLAEELRHKGCKDLLHKPFEPAELIRRVLSVLGERAAEEECSCPA